MKNSNFKYNPIGICSLEYRRHAIIWTNGGLVYSRIYTLLVLDELNKIICSQAENVWNIILRHLVDGKLAWRNLGIGRNQNYNSIIWRVNEIYF